MCVKNAPTCETIQYTKLTVIITHTAQFIRMMIYSPVRKKME